MITRPDTQFTKLSWQVLSCPNQGCVDFSFLRNFGQFGRNLFATLSMHRYSICTLHQKKRALQDLLARLPPPKGTRARRSPRECYISEPDIRSAFVHYIAQTHHAQATRTTTFETLRPLLRSVGIDQNTILPEPARRTHQPRDPLTPEDVGRLLAAADSSMSASRRRIAQALTIASKSRAALRDLPPWPERPTELKTKGDVIAYFVYMLNSVPQSTSALAQSNAIWFRDTVQQHFDSLHTLYSQVHPNAFDTIGYIVALQLCVGLNASSLLDLSTSPIGYQLDGSSCLIYQKNRSSGGKLLELSNKKMENRVSRLIKEFDWISKRTRSLSPAMSHREFLWVSITRKAIKKNEFVRDYAGYLGAAKFYADLMEWFQHMFGGDDLYRSFTSRSRRYCGMIQYSSRGHNVSALQSAAQWLGHASRMPRQEYSSCFADDQARRVAYLLDADVFVRKCEAEIENGQKK